MILSELEHVLAFAVTQVAQATQQVAVGMGNAIEAGLRIRKQGKSVVMMLNDDGAVVIAGTMPRGVYQEADGQLRFETQMVSDAAAEFAQKAAEAGVTAITGTGP